MSKKLNPTENVYLYNALEMLRDYYVKEKRMFDEENKKRKKQGLEQKYSGFNENYHYAIIDSVQRKTVNMKKIKEYNK
jgi:hypothetical protein